MRFPEGVVGEEEGVSSRQLLEGRVLRLFLRGFLDAGVMESLEEFGWRREHVRKVRREDQERTLGEKMNMRRQGEKTR